MRIKMEAQGLWGRSIPVTPISRWIAIYSIVPLEMITALSTKDSTLEAWESIKVMWIGDDHIRKASVQKVQCEYEVLNFCNGEDAEDFAMRLSVMVNQLAFGRPGAR
jgi:hypothetical protein